VADDPESPTFVVYAENKLSANPNVRRQRDEAFSQLDYAIYLNDESPENLLGASVQDDELPIDGRRESALSPFGDEQLLLVMTPIGQMSSWLFANLWWIVGLLGIVLAVGAAWLTRNLYRRREEALALAADNARLYDEQRHIAETLQLSLLPQELIPPPGGAVAARYWPAGEASLIGGDFYDAFQVDDRRWAVVIGDVCGKGVDAAAITGLARHTLRAAARSATAPSAVLHEVHRALLEHQPSTFCTVCFFYVTVADDGSQSVTIALGGHPGPLLRRVDGRVDEIGVPGSLLGLFTPTLVDSTVAIEPGDTIVLYTDGLTDAPQDQAVPLGELIDLLAAEGDEPVALLADSIRPLKRRRRPHGSADDTAIVVLRVGSPTAAHDGRVDQGADAARSATV
jgi:serine phosphatase RsbU (regulator of sigma subunit)